jgi:hypothetical protein
MNPVEPLRVLNKAEGIVDDAADWETMERYE